MSASTQIREDLFKLEKYEISVSGMTCSNCSNYLESSLKQVAQIKSANVNLILENALIVLEEFNLFEILKTNKNLADKSLQNNEDFLLNIIKNIGFTVNNIKLIEDKENKARRFMNLTFDKKNLHYNLPNQYTSRQDKNEQVKNPNKSQEKEDIYGNTSIQHTTFTTVKNNVSENNFVFDEEINDAKSKTHILTKNDIELIHGIQGVVEISLVKKNSFYRLEYDSSLVKGNELLENLKNIFESDKKNNDLKTKDNILNTHNNVYHIVYTNEFKKNISEIYEFHPTTDFWRMLCCIVLLAIIFSFTFYFQTNKSSYISLIKLTGNIQLFLAFGLFLNTLMIIFYGYRIYKKSFIAFINSYLVNMDTLITLGSVSAIFLTILNFVQLLLLDNPMNINSSEDFQLKVITANIMTLHSAEAAASVIAISVIGKYVEEKAKNNIKKLTVNMFSDEKIFFRNFVNLVKPANKSFTKYLFDKKVDVGLLEKGDFCKLSSGDFLLFDCVILKGKIEVNENSEYGYNKIQKKAVGDRLKSGMQIVSIIESDCIVSVGDVIEESMLFKVIKEMNLSLNQKLKFQHFIDKIIKWFVPIIILISITTTLVWLVIKFIFSNTSINVPNLPMSTSNVNGESTSNNLNKIDAEYEFITYSFILERAISILVVSCPCAFGLAIPTVTTIALNKALKSGILIKNLSILPEVRKANCFIFDKTGTLTSVKKDVKIEYLNDIIQVNEYKNENNIIQEINNTEVQSTIKIPIFEIIALLESSQKHPIAEILYSYAVKKIEDQLNEKSKNKKTNNEYINKVSISKGISDQETLDSSSLKETINLINDSLIVDSSGLSAEIKFTLTTEDNIDISKIMNSKQNKTQVADNSLLNYKNKILFEKNFKVLIGSSKFIFKNHQIQMSNSYQDQCNDTNAKKSIDNNKLLKESCNLQSVIKKISNNSSTNVFISIDNNINAILTIDTSSSIRPEIKFVLDELRLQGKRTLILSGDNCQSVQEVGKKLGFTGSDLIGEVNNIEKKEILQCLKKEKNKNNVSLLMIGDGINDVLSLSEADYGISFNAHSQLNLVASDVIFIKEDLSLILSLIKLSKLTYIFIWINIFWAFIYNIFMIPIATGLFRSLSAYTMSPTISSISMLGSSLLIIFTSNLLRLFEIDYKPKFINWGRISEDNNLPNSSENNCSKLYISHNKPCCSQQKNYTNISDIINEENANTDNNDDYKLLND